MTTEQLAAQKAAARDKKRFVKLRPAEKAMVTLGAMTCVFAVAAGICLDCGLKATGFALIMLSVTSLLAIAPVSDSR